MWYKSNQRIPRRRIRKTILAPHGSIIYKQSTMTNKTLEEVLTIENIERALKESCEDQTAFLKKHWLI